MSTRKSVSNEKKQLLSQLLLSVKNCQSRFGSRTELATEDDKLISQLCQAFEEVFLHGIKRPASQTSKGIWQMTESLVPASLRYSEVSSFWHLIKSQLSKHEAERFLLLHNVRTDLGRGRAWLRAALNEHSLERYIHVVLSLDTLTQFYEDFSFLLDDELSSILPQTAAGLGSILFALIVDNPVLDRINSDVMPSTDEDTIAKATNLAELADEAEALNKNKSSPESLTEQGITKLRKGKKKKKVPTAYVSFDEAESSGPSCISTPTEKHAPASVSTSATKTAPMCSQVIPPTTSLPTVIASSSLPQDIPTIGLEKPFATNYSSSLKSSDNLSIYSDTSDRIDAENLSLSKILPCDRLKPVGCSEDGSSSLNLVGDPDRSQDLIPVPSYTNGDDDVSQEFDPEKNSNASGSTSGFIFPSDVSSVQVQKESPEDKIQGSDVDERVRRLKLVLDHEVEMVTTLTAQLADERRHFNDQSKMLETRIETLTKENELLKHQLKKYIGAVQLLKESGSGNRMSMLLDQNDVDILENSAADEQSTEAAEYERKLIQVAEMHGELMEFNAYLQAVLQRKDHALRNLRDELEDLRGPLCDVDDDELPSSLDRQLPETGNGQRPFPFLRQLTTNERILINTWIPSAFLTGATNDLHHVYQVFLRIKDTEWNVYRRYSQFYNFHSQLKKQDSVIDSFYFPPKKHIGNRDTKFVDERRRKLQDYLRKVINHTMQTNSVLASHPDKNLLISILPFFGEVTPPIKPKRSRSRGRNLFFRQSDSSAEHQFLQESGIIQYTAL